LESKDRSYRHFTLPRVAFVVGVLFAKLREGCFVNWTGRGNLYCSWDGIFRYRKISLLEKGEVDFAFVQSGLEGSQRVRTVAKLYDEVLHVMVHRDSGRTHLSDLKGACISLGAKGSGSRVVGIDLLEHFGVEVFQEKPLEPREAIEALKKKEIDAVFLVTALQSEVVRDAMGEGQVRFVNLAEGSAGVVARYPHLSLSLSFGGERSNADE